MINQYRYKPQRLKHLSEVQTIDIRHKEKMDTFEKQRNNKDTNVLLLQELQYNLDVLNKVENITIEISKQKAKLKDEIELLQSNINFSHSNNGEIDYFYKVQSLLFDYYDIENNEQYTQNTLSTKDIINQAEKPEQPEQIQTISILNNLEESNNILLEDVTNEHTDKLPNNIDTGGISIDLFMLHEKNKNTRKIKKPIKKRNNPTSNQQTITILDYIASNNENTPHETIEKITSNKATLYMEYLNLIDNETNFSLKNTLIKMCEICNVEKLLVKADGMMVCPLCGRSESIIIESDIPSHNEVINEKPRYPYKKINHLIERLNQFQSKENTNIPDDVYEKIYIEIKKKKLDTQSITPKFIKLILKKYRLIQFYEHTQSIYIKITKNKPPFLTKAEEEEVKLRFKQIEKIFPKFKPKKRSNFLNYAFVINKLFYIMGKGDYANYFNLLKNKDKLKYQDKVWYKICEELNWPFQSSF